MTSLNIELARRNMVEQQIRPWDVLDSRVLELMTRVPRENFVPASLRSLAFVDMEIPIGEGQRMMAPKMEARLLQALEVRAGDRILEVGTGSGYLTALLASLGAHVMSVELSATLSQEAAARLAMQRISNVTLEVGDAAHGWDRRAPYDVIVLTGSVARIPEALRASLAPGGRLFAVVGEPPVMEARLLRRLADNNWSEASLFDTELAPLLNAARGPAFVF